MRKDGDGATLNGGDMLYPVRYERDVGTGAYDIPVVDDHLFVGISFRTNIKDVQY